MADLSTLDATAPPSSEAVSSGDDRIRETRDATKTSFGGVDNGTGTQASEHYLKGFHKFPNGNAAARPAAGNAGRLYLNTTDKRLERDTGAAWNQLNAVQVAVGVCSATLSVGTVSFTPISGMTATVDVMTGGAVLLSGMVQLTNSGTQTVTLQLQQAGTGVRDMVVIMNTGDPSRLVPFVWMILAPTTGSVTYRLAAKCTGASLMQAGASGVDQLIVQVM